MRNCNTYFMCSHTKDDNAEFTDIVGVAIVDKNIEMTTSEKRSLIHYLAVIDCYCMQHIGTVLSKMIFSQNYSNDRNIMAAKRLSKAFLGIMFGEFHDLFFDEIKFKEMK